MAVRLVNLAQGVRRLHPRRAGAGQHPRQHALRLHLRLVGRRHGVDRLGDDPADGEGRLSARVRHQRHDLRLGAGADDPAVAQRRDLFARRRRHDLGRASVPRRHLPGPAVRPVPDRARAWTSTGAAIRRASRCRCSACRRSSSTRCGGWSPSSSSWAGSCPASSRRRSRRRSPASTPSS